MPFVFLSTFDFYLLSPTTDIYIYNPSINRSMCGHNILYQSMDQPDKVANPGRGQLNRKYEYFPIIPVGASEFDLARRIRRSRPASARSFSILRLNHQSSIWCLLTEFLPISAAASIYLYRRTPSGQSRVYRVAQLRTDGVHCRNSAGTGPVVLKVVPGTGAAFASPWTNLCAPLFSHPHYWYEVWSGQVEGR